MVQQPRRVLELFSGTGSVGRWARAHGFEVVSLDILQSANATITSDIMLWDFKSAYPPGYFEIVWSSPPCVMFSCARTTGPPRDLDGANAIVKRTIDIINYFDPLHWYIETPGTGLLPKQEYTHMYNRVIADYCRYSTETDRFFYRKRSCFFSNRVALLANPPLKCNGACDGIKAPVPGAGPNRKTHAMSFGGQRGGKRFYLVSNLTLDRKHAIPQLLIEKLLVG